MKLLTVVRLKPADVLHIMMMEVVIRWVWLTHLRSSRLRMSQNQNIAICLHHTDCIWRMGERERERERPIQLSLIIKNTLGKNFWIIL